MKHTTENLKTRITEIDGLSQEGFDKIKAIANLTRHKLEHSTLDVFELEDLINSLLVIRDIASESMNAINCAAEDVGCNHVSRATIAQIQRLGASQEVTQ